MNPLSDGKLLADSAHERQFRPTLHHRRPRAFQVDLFTLVAGCGQVDQQVAARGEGSVSLRGRRLACWRGRRHPVPMQQI